MSDRTPSTRRRATGDGTRITPEVLKSNVARLLASWGMPSAHARASASVLVQADLFGIESHGVSMLSVYEGYRDAGILVMSPEVEVVRETPVAALIDAGGGLGHYPSGLATELVIGKARGAGMGVAAVRNSNHFGAAGVYALRIAENGLLGFAFTSVGKASVVPTRGTRPMFGTNPIAFAAPAKRNRPFLLDMATSTAAVGKLMVAAREGRELPPVWAMAADGRPETDPNRALEHRLLLPLGGASTDTGGHKGYGLAAMVEILTSVLAGGTFAPLRPIEQKRFDVGHLFLAVDPALFRGPGEFESDVDALVDALRASPAADHAQPVLVAGDPEYAAQAERREQGIPMSAELRAKLEAMFARAGLVLEI